MNPANGMKSGHRDTFRRSYPSTTNSPMSSTFHATLFQPLITARARAFSAWLRSLPYRSQHNQTASRRMIFAPSASYLDDA
jgi:hypothetical protein